MTSEKRKSCLMSLRILDMAEGGCEFCGKIFGDLGADVVKIEPPCGSSSRHIGPFYKDIPDPEKSLFWFAFNTDKRSITLDIDTADGQRIFKKMVESADIVIESYTPGYLDSLGIGYDALSQINAGLILTSITPFGQTGPKAHYKSSELTAWAASGGLFTTGDPDRAPVWISFPQPSIHAGAEACAGTLIAYFDRLRNGHGQHVDVSIRDTFFWSTDQLRLQEYEETGRIYQRAGSKMRLATGVGRSEVFACKDGFVVARAEKGTATWMAEEGMAPDWLVNYDWVVNYDTLRLTQEEVDRVEKVFGEFFLTKTKAELFEQAFKRGISIAPLNMAEDICNMEQLQARKFWVDVEHDELNDTLPYCGPLKNIFSESPGSIRKRAPLIGEHNLDIYEGELGFSREELDTLKNSGTI